MWLNINHNILVQFLLVLKRFFFCLATGLKSFFFSFMEHTAILKLLNFTAKDDKNYNRYKGEYIHHGGGEAKIGNCSMK